MTDAPKLLLDVSDEALMAALAAYQERMKSTEFAAKVATTQAERTRFEGALRPSADAISAPALSSELQNQLESAERLFSKDFLGPKQFEKAWGFAPSYVPAIPFSPKRLASAQKLGMMLRLAVDKAPDGSPMTMKTMNAMQAEGGRNPKVLYNTDWYNDEAFYHEAPRAGWRLESKALLPNSTAKTEVGQLELIVAHLQSVVFRGMTMPSHYGQAIAQFEAQKARITALMESNTGWPQASAMIEVLDLCKLTRATPAELIQAIETRHQNDENGNFPYTNTYVRTPRRSSDGSLVRVGGVDADGASVRARHPGYRPDYIGVTLSLQS